MLRVNISGGSPYEPTVGYSRAVRVGDALYIAGTTASSEGGPLAAGPHAALAQAREALAIIRRVLEANGSRVEDVVRTRMFVVDIAAHGAAVGAAHGEVFGSVRPAASMLGVAALIDAAMLVEVEVDAVVGCGGAPGAPPAGALSGCSASQAEVALVLLGCPHQLGHWPSRRPSCAAPATRTPRVFFFSTSPRPARPPRAVVGASAALSAAAAAKGGRRPRFDKRIVTARC